MDIQTTRTIIIGAGLSGIYVASRLAETREAFIVLEARDRAGGRIQCREFKGYATDLGPSWYWPAINPRVKGLIQELGLTGYPQFDRGYGRFQAPDGSIRTIPGYPMAPEGWRLRGGMNALINGLLKTIPPNCLRLNHPVCEIEDRGGHVRVSVGKPGEAPQCRFDAARVILALPPRLAAASILFTPDLSPQLAQAMLRTSTWMAGHAKFFAVYDKAAWRTVGLSGQAFSQCGPMGEVHDGSGSKAGPFGLTGFLAVPAAQRRNQQTLIQAILNQLSQLYGDEAGNPAAVFYTDWATEPYTATEYDQRAAHDHPLYQPPSGKAAIWDNSVLFAGTETAHEYGGYLEGALASAQRAIAAIRG